MKSKIFSIFFALIFYIALPISVSKVVLASEETREQVKLMFRINTDTIIFCNENTGENCNSSIYRSGKSTSYKELLSKNPNIEICYRPNYQKIFAVKTFQKTRSSSHSSAKITNKNCNQVFIDAKILIHVKNTLFVTYSQIEIDKIKKKKKAAEEKRIADAKVAEEERIADAKVAEEERIAEEKVAEEERIAEEKRAKEIRKNRILGMECSDLQKQSTGQKFGKVVEILYIDDPEQSFRDDNNLECRANAKLSDARNIEIKMKIYRENGQIFTSIEVLN